MTRHLRTLADLGPEGLRSVLDRAAELKRLRGTPEHPRSLAGKSVALVFEKASTRTRISFEVGVHELGGNPVPLISKDTQLERGESVEDTARMFSGYVHAVVYRTHGHDRLEQMATFSSVPVINGLSDKFHPCQLIADLQTVRECTGGRLEGVRVAWIGDGNNMANSWILSAALTGLELVLACPKGYEPPADVIAMARAINPRASIEVVPDPKAAARGAHIVTTDVWASMGQEHEAQAREKAFRAFLVDDALMALADKDAAFLHCLPAHRGEEVTASVIDGPQSRVWQEAENRLHGQKALLEWAFAKI
jgi:ornithine carbamoyltransferase